MAAPFVILLMLAGWLLEAKRDRERRRRYDARIRANAYELAELLDGWMGMWPDWAVDGERNSWPQAVTAARAFADDAPTARKLARALVEDAPGATDPLAEVAREVFPRVMSCVRFVESVAQADAGATVEAELEQYVATEFATYRKDFVGRAYDLLAAEIEDLREHARW